MSFSNSESDDEDGVIAEINVTPLVDVMLVLLIIFMITAPMMTTGMRVDLPRPAPHSPSTSSRLSSLWHRATVSRLAMMMCRAAISSAV